MYSVRNSDIEILSELRNPRNTVYLQKKTCCVRNDSGNREKNFFIVLKTTFVENKIINAILIKETSMLLNVSKMNSFDQSEKCTLILMRSVVCDICLKSSVIDRYDSRSFFKYIKHQIKIEI